METGRHSGCNIPPDMEEKPKELVILKVWRKSEAAGAFQIHSCKTRTHVLVL